MIMRKNLGIILLYSTIFNSHKFHFIVVFMGSNFCTRLIISLSRKLNIFGDNIVKKIQLICRLSNRLKYTAFYVDEKKNNNTNVSLFGQKLILPSNRTEKNDFDLWPLWLSTKLSKLSYCLRLHGSIRLVLLISVLVIQR